MEHGFSGPAIPRFQHEAVFYHGLDGLPAATVPFIIEGLERREPVLVATLPDRIRRLRSALGSDADRVRFLDMRDVGGNPARIIPVWRGFVEESARDGPARGVGEPVWSTRSEVELEECRLHESLLNVAFDEGPAWRLMCPYDVDALAPTVVEAAKLTHPVVVPAGSGAAEYGGHQHALAAFASPLPPAPDSARRLMFDGELRRVRDVVRLWSTEAGLPPRKADDLALAVHELATNSIVHGGGGGVLEAWAVPGSFLLQVSDAGYIADPLVGRDLVPGSAGGGRGVWIVHQLCDLVQLRSSGTGTMARLHTWL